MRLSTTYNFHFVYVCVCLCVYVINYIKKFVLVAQLHESWCLSGDNLTDKDRH